MNSFRGHMMISIAAVVVLAMLLLGFAIVTINSNQLRSAIDGELLDRVDAFAHGGPPMMRGPQPDLGPPNQGRNAFSGPNPQPPPPDANLFGSIRRPRIIPVEAFQGAGELPGDIFDLEAAQRAANGENGFSTVSFGGEEVRVYSALVRRGMQPDVVMQVARETRGIGELRRVQVNTLLMVLPLAVIGAVLVAYLLAGRVMKPIADMSRATKQIAGGDFSARIDTRGNDEFAELGKQFNQMADHVDDSMAKLKTALEQQRRFTADASHELRTPLTRLRLATSSGLAGGRDEELRALHIADQTGRDMTQLVDQLLALANADAGTLKSSFAPVDLRAVVADALQFFQDGAAVQTEFGDVPVMIHADAAQITRAVRNLVENALRHAPKGTVTVSVRQAGDQAVLEVKDTGEGIASEHIPHLTERFYRVDSARNRDGGGAGLGLAIVSEIVKAHEGQLKISSEVGKGTTVALSFLMR